MNRSEKTIEYVRKGSFQDPRRMILLGATILMGLLAVGGSLVFISPGNVGILIHRMGGAVDPTPLIAGFHFKWPILQEIVEYPIYMQTLDLSRSEGEGKPYNEGVNVNSVEGQPISCDVSLSFELDPFKVPYLYSSFRTDENLSITQGFVMQAIRQSMQEVVGQTEVGNFLGKDRALVVKLTEENLQKRLLKYGFLIRQFTINEVRAPASIIRAIEAKNVMAQEALRAQNELQKKQFEAQQKIIEIEGEVKSLMTRAKGQTEPNQLVSPALTPALVEYKRAGKSE